MKRKFLSALAAFGLMCAVLVGAPFATAEATSNWPLVMSGAVQSVAATSDGSVQVDICTQGTATTPNAAFIDSSGVTRGGLPGPGTADKVLCATRSGIGAEDGVLYGYRTAANEATSELVAWKNNRQLWSTPTTSATNCGYGFTSYTMMPSSFSQGSNGAVYMVLTGATLQTSACSDRLLGVNPTTGAVVLDVAIGVPPSNSGRLRTGGSVAWTYSDRIAVVNRSGLLQEYDYSGTPLLATPVSFVPSQYFAISQLAANDQGTIFAFGSGDGFQTGSLLFYKADGTSGSVTIAIPYTGVDVYQLQPTVDGNIIGIPYGTAGRIDHIDLANQTVTSSNLVPSTVGYATSVIIDYVTDAAGNALVHWSQSSGNDKATSVDLYDSAGSVVSNIFLKQKKMADLANYPDFYDMGDAQLKNAIGGGSVYLLVCENATSVCFSQSATTTINKVSVGNFGTPLGKGFKRNTYSSQKLQYVAMGDSYSSGEGNPPFNPWTDRSGVNECHRSEDIAYPQWLVKHSGLNLELADFVACSGATTDTVLNGGSGTGAWSEAPQIDSLSSTTDRVTITIGGNDVGFGDVLRRCIRVWLPGWDHWGCSANSILFDLVNERLAALAGTSAGMVDSPEGKEIHSITSVLAAIAAKAPNAALYIAGYPRLFGSDTTYFTQDASAPGGFYCDTSTSTFAYADTEWMNQKADQLNQVISDAVTAAKSSGMNVTYVPPALFAGHRFCDSGGSYLYGMMIGNIPAQITNPGSMHPDQNGQNIAYGQMFEAMMQ